jgi:tetratricopeptide (TPR) repeat protein
MKCKQYLKKNHKIISIIIIILVASLWLTNYYDLWSGQRVKAHWNVFYAQQALVNSPNNYDHLMTLGLNQYILKNFNKSLEAYTKAATVNPQGYLAWNNLGNLKRDLMDFWGAEEAYTKAIEIKPQYVPAYINLIDLYTIWPIDECKDRKEKLIIPTLQRGIENNPENEQLIEILKTYLKNS